MSTRTLAEPLVTEEHVESFKRDGIDLEVLPSRFELYHPVLNMSRKVVSHVAEHAGGGPCGDISWEGSVH